jgi:hypothetical protein
MIREDFSDVHRVEHHIECHPEKKVWAPETSNNLLGVPDELLQKWSSQDP